ncbi:MAG: NADH-quinone oxidoreductase subunit M [Cyanobacteria bacterium P01_H01_bin.15]
MLSALIWLPIFSAALIGFIPANRSSSHYRNISIVLATVFFLFSLVVAGQFDPTTPAFQLPEDIAWNETLGLRYHLGIDGLSLPLVVLNGLLTLIAIAVTKAEIERPRLYYSMILLLSGSVVGAFLAQDLLLFFLFYELEIIPLYFLIAIWGGKRRGYAAMKFLLYTALSGILVLLSFIGLAWFGGGDHLGFDYSLLRQSVLPLETQILLLIPLLIGFLIKIPIFPFHTWLPDAHVEASTPISILLAGVLLKLGTYGLLRFGIGLFLDAWTYLAPWLAILAAVSALYGAACAIAQTDMKKVVAYSSISHMGYILLAAAASTPLSLTAAEFQMVSHGLISGLLFLIVGVVYAKTGTRDITVLRGLLNPQRGLPLTGSLMIIGAMASAGIPGMVGFIAEFLVFRGSFPIFPVATLLCLVATGLTAVYFLLVINRVFFGRLLESILPLPSVQWGESLPALILTAAIVIFGIQPNWMVRWSEVETTSLVTGDWELVNKAKEQSPPLELHRLPKHLRKSQKNIAQTNLSNSE